MAGVDIAMRVTGCRNQPNAAVLVRKHIGEPVPRSVLWPESHPEVGGGLPLEGQRLVLSRCAVRPELLLQASHLQSTEPSALPDAYQRQGVCNLTRSSIVGLVSIGWGGGGTLPTCTAASDMVRPILEPVGEAVL